jgi:hypothetical protein
MALIGGLKSSIGRLWGIKMDTGVGIMGGAEFAAFLAAFRHRLDSVGGGMEGGWRWRRGR